MDFQNITSVISSVGFPIVMCLLLGWYIAKKMDTLSQKIDSLTNSIDQLRLSEKFEDILTQKHGSNNG